MFGKKKPMQEAAHSVSTHPGQANPHARVSFTKVPAPLRPAYNDAGKVLMTKGITTPLEMKLLIDRSGSMGSYFDDGSIWQLGERILAATANVDDDGEFQCGYYDTDFRGVFHVSLDNYLGRLETVHQSLGSMGTTNTYDGMVAMYGDWRKRGKTNNIPGVCIVQTDGRPDNENAVTALVRNTSVEKFHWVFIAYGEKNSAGVKFLERLDNLPGRSHDNVTTIKAGSRPQEMKSADLYRGIFSEIPKWLRNFQ